MRRAPGPRGHWLLGNLPERRRDALGLFMRGAAEFGPIVRFRMGLFDSYLLTEPAFIKHVLQDNHAAYRKGPIYEKLEALIGKGLITSEGDFWRRQRRLVQPVFQQKRMSELLPLMDEIVRARLDAWERAGERTIDVVAEMTTLTMDIICVSLFGRRALPRIKEISEAGMNFVDEFSAEVLELFKPLGILLNRAPKQGPAIRRLRGIIAGLIDDRRRSAGTEDASALLSLLLDARDEQGRRMTEEVLLDEVMTLFVAGHETTAMALGWTLYLLADHVDVQRKLRRILAAENADAPLADLLRLSYPRMVVEEGMRLYPPVWSLPRRAEQDDEIGGYRIPKGAFVVLSSYVMHRQARFFPEPDVFRPERFSEDPKKRPGGFTYFPFGAGSRHCAGSNFAMTEMQAILVRLFRRFELELVPGQRIMPLPLGTLKPDGPIMMIPRRYNAT